MQHLTLKRALKNVKLPGRWLTGFLVSSLLGCLVYLFLVIRQSTAQSHLPSETVAAVTKDLTLRYTVNGVVQAVRTSKLSPDREGQIVELYVEEGDRVEQGQVVARMDHRELQAQVNQYQGVLAQTEAELALKQAGNRPQEIAEAEAKVATAAAEMVQAQARAAQAQAERQRNQRLVDQGAISSNQFSEYLTKEQEAVASLQAAQARLREQQQSFDRTQQGSRHEEIAQAAARVTEAEAQLQYYQTQLADTQIQAPFAGVITRLFVQEGDFVTPTTSASSDESATSASIAELSDGLEVEVNVPEANISQLQVGQAVEVRTDAYPNEVFQGQIRLIAPRAIKENNITFFRTKIELTTGQDRLKLGMNVKIDVLGNQIENALVIPLAAVVTQPSGETGVFVLDEANQTQFRSITVGATAEDSIQVLKGITAGEQVVLSPPDGGDALADDSLYPN
jgi:HlyD family secretion protein